MKRNDQYENLGGAGRVLGYFIPLGVFLGGAYLYHERKKRLGRKAAKAKDLDRPGSKYKLAYILDVSELRGVDTELYPAVGQTIRVTASGAVGTNWQAQVEPADAVKVDQTDTSSPGVGGHTQVFNFTLRKFQDARVTLTAIGPGNQVVDSVFFDIDAEE